MTASPLPGTSALPPSLGGVPLVGSPYVPEGKFFQVDGRLLYHSRISAKAKWRRPHGRTNGPRRMRVKYVRYQPDLDRLLEATP